MKKNWRKIVALIICLSVLACPTKLAYAAEEDESRIEEFSAQSDNSVSDSEVVTRDPNTPAETDVQDMSRVPETVEEVIGVDEHGNTFVVEDTESGAVEDGATAYSARSASTKVVNFRADSSGTVVTDITEYTEYETGRSGYIYGRSGADGAYLGTEGGKIKFLQSGVIGLVDASKVQVVTLGSVESYSNYYANGTNLIHNICMDMTTPGYGSSINVGTQPSYLTTGTTYYSYDGHYFYTDYDLMLGDYQADTRKNAVNASNPYYNYFQYLPLRGKSGYSADEMNAMVNGKLSSSDSKMYNTGRTFVEKQNIYGVNALLMAGVAALESGWGTSSIAKQKNNLFGLNAVDSSPGESADSFSSVEACINDFAETYMSKRYLRAGWTYYHGGFLGDKASGINVSYASDPYWGEKIASIAWEFDNANNKKDQDKYTLGIKDMVPYDHTDLNVRKEATTSSTRLFSTGDPSNFAFLILGESGDFYKIQSDPVLDSSRESINKDTGKYDSAQMYAYVSKNYVQKVSEGTGGIVDNGIAYSTHVQSYGWQAYKKNGATAGTTGEAKRIEAIKIRLDNPEYSGTVQYRSLVQSYGWLDWVNNDLVSGTTGEGKRMEAIQIKLTGDMEKHYDVYYRAHVQGIGWLDWAKNGETAGSMGGAKRMEAIEIRLVEKGGAAPGTTGISYKQYQLRYSTHVQNEGWQDASVDGETNGTTGEALRLEGIKICLLDPNYSGDVEYKVHVQSYGWQDWVKNGSVAGTTGESKRLEAIRIRLTGEMAENYDIYYRVHAQSYGWLDWAKNGEIAGTAGGSKRLEAIEIVLVDKGQSAPGETETSFVQQLIQYRSNVESYDWQQYVFGGQISGTVGEAKRMEAVQISPLLKGYQNDIKYRVHVQSKGWQSWRDSNEVAGTLGEEKRLEAIEIKLTGELAEKYDVYYRAHCQSYGWLDWAKNGEMAGTEGLKKRMEAFQVVLVEKGQEAPGSTKTPNVTE